MKITSTFLLVLHIVLALLCLFVFGFCELVHGSENFLWTLLVIFMDFAICFIPYCYFIVRNKQEQMSALLLYAFSGFFMSWIFGALILIALGVTALIFGAAVVCIPVAALCYLLVGSLTCALFRRLFARLKKE